MAEGPASPAILHNRPVLQQYDYSQPLNTAAAPPEQAAADQATSAVGQAREAFQAGDYATATQAHPAGARADAERRHLA